MVLRVGSFVRTRRGRASVAVRRAVFTTAPTSGCSSREFHNRACFSARYAVEPEGGFLRGGFVFLAGLRFVGGGEAHADGLGNPELLHRHAIHHVGAGHGALGVGDDDELRAVDEAVEHLDEAADVRLVERRVEFVEHAERAGLDHVDREQQRDGGHRALATGEQRDRLQLLAGRLGDDLDAGFERVALVEQHEVGLALLAEEFLEHVAEVDLRTWAKVSEKQALGFLVDALDDFEQLGLRGDQVVVLVAQEVVAFLEFLELLDGIEVDRAHRIEAALDVGDDGSRRSPSPARRSSRRGFRCRPRWCHRRPWSGMSSSSSSDSSESSPVDDRLRVPLRACRAFCEAMQASRAWASGSKVARSIWWRSGSCWSGSRGAGRAWWRRLPRGPSARRPWRARGGRRRAAVSAVSMASSSSARPAARDSISTSRSSASSAVGFAFLGEAGVFGDGRLDPLVEAIRSPSRGGSRSRAVRRGGPPSAAAAPRRPAWRGARRRASVRSSLRASVEFLLAATAASELGLQPAGSVSSASSRSRAAASSLSSAARPSAAARLAVFEFAAFPADVFELGFEVLHLAGGQAELALQGGEFDLLALQPLAGDLDFLAQSLELRLRVRSRGRGRPRRPLSSAATSASSARTSFWQFEHRGGAFPAAPPRRMPSPPSISPARVTKVTPGWSARRRRAVARFGTISTCSSRRSITPATRGSDFTRSSAQAIAPSGSASIWVPPACRTKVSGSMAAMPSLLLGEALDDRFGQRPGRATSTACRWVPSAASIARAQALSASMNEASTPWMPGLNRSGSPRPSSTFWVPFSKPSPLVDELAHDFEARRRAGRASCAPPTAAVRAASRSPRVC